MFQVPGLGPVPESRLPTLGYQQIHGQWLTPQQFQQFLNYQQQNPSTGGGNQNTAQAIANWIQVVGPSVLGIIQSLGNGNNNGGGILDGGSAGGGV